MISRETLEEPFFSPDPFKTEESETSLVSLNVSLLPLAQLLQEIVPIGNSFSCDNDAQLIQKAFNLLNFPLSEELLVFIALHSTYFSH